MRDKKAIEADLCITSNFSDRLVKDNYSVELIAELLRYISKGKDTYEIAVSLVNKFGDIKGVLSAKFDELNKVGLDENEVVFIQLVNTIVRKYYISLLSQPVINKLPYLNIKQFLLSLYGGLTREHLLLIMYDNSEKYIKHTILSIGAPNEVSFNKRDLFEEVILNDASFISIAHNHPSNHLTPSYTDVEITKLLSLELSAIKVGLIDHYIIGSKMVFSIVKNRYL